MTNNFITIKRLANVLVSENKIMLTNSISDQNVYFTYICLVNDINPSNHVRDKDYEKSYHTPEDEDESIDNDEEPIQVAKSKALHELVDSHRKDEIKLVEDKVNNETGALIYPATTSGGGNESEKDDHTFLCFDNPNILKLTKMKWLTEGTEGAPDSSSPSLSPVSSTCSVCSKGSVDIINSCISLDKRYLATIVRIDKEHNMFGLSNIAIDGLTPYRKIRKEENRAVFHQTAIVQICSGCCRHKSNTDLPNSLKCGGCRGCCADPSCTFCIGPCGSVNNSPPCPSASPCPPPKCMMDCSFGFKISLSKKPTYEPSPVELTPRSSCVLIKPLAARSCHHLPRCVPPSSCFPYLLPCYWPARAAAPCNDPTRCFHNPPCPPKRRPKSIIPPEELCPKTGKCEDSSKKTKCPNIACPGNNPSFKKEIENRFAKKSK